MTQCKKTKNKYEKIQIHKKLKYECDKMQKDRIQI